MQTNLYFRYNQYLCLLEVIFLEKIINLNIAVSINFSSWFNSQNSTKKAR